MYDFEVFALLYFVPTEELNSKGNPKTIPVVVRKMILIPRDRASFQPLQVKIVRLVRGEVAKYSVKELVEGETDLWSMKPPPAKWVKVDSFTECEVQDFLARRLGNYATEALHELINKKAIRA